MSSNNLDTYLDVLNDQMDQLGLCKKQVPGIRKSRRGHRMCAIHILECIQKIEYVCCLDPNFDNAILYDAVIRNLQTLTESTRYLKKEIRFNHPEVPWKIVRRLRNELVHGYLTVNTDIAIKALIMHDMLVLKNILVMHYPDWFKEKKKRVLPLSAHVSEKLLPSHNIA